MSELEDIHGSIATEAKKPVSADCAALPPNSGSPSSATTEKVVELLRARDSISLSKYRGQTMDRTDLTAAQWARHLIEEQADGIKYAMRMEGGLPLLEEARRLLGMRSPNAAELDWIERHDEQFFPENH